MLTTRGITCLIAGEALWEKCEGRNMENRDCLFANAGLNRLAIIKYYILAFSIAYLAAS